MNAGEKASGIAVIEFKEALDKVDGTLDISEFTKLIQDYTARTSKLIYDTSLENNEYKGMGTTFVGLCICKDAAVALNVGDSRCYSYVNGVSKQLSSDHTRAAENVLSGLITKGQERYSPGRNKLTRFLGMPLEYGNMKCSVSDIVFLSENSRFILCSDGLYDKVEEDEMIKVLGISEIGKCANELVNLAIKNGGDDNVTVTVIDVLPG